MRFKFPKKIIIGDAEFDIFYSKKNDAASFQYPYEGKRGYIKLGTNDLKTNPTRFLCFLIHELKEIIQTEQCTRFMRRDEHSENSYEFHYTHKEHTDLLCEAGRVVKLFYKMKFQDIKPLL